MRNGGALCNWPRIVRSQYWFDCRALLQRFPALLVVEEPRIRRRDANESPHHLGVGDRFPSRFVAIATRALRGRCVFGRGLPAQTAGRNSSSSARHLSTSPELSS